MDLSFRVCRANGPCKSMSCNYLTCTSVWACNMLESSRETWPKCQPPVSIGICIQGLALRPPTGKSCGKLWAADRAADTWQWTPCNDLRYMTNSSVTILHILVIRQCRLIYTNRKTVEALWKVILIETVDALEGHIDTVIRR